MWHVKESGAAPVTNVTARYGFGERWDLGLRLGTSGVGVSGKFGLGDPYARTLALALAPSVSAASWGRRPIHVQVPLVMGLLVGPHELIVTPKLQAWSSARTIQSRRKRSTVIAAGMSLGASVRIAPGVRILPEVTFVRPFLGSISGRGAFSDVELRPGLPLYQVSLGVLLGGETNWWRRDYGPPYYGGRYPY